MNRALLFFPVAVSLFSQRVDASQLICTVNVDSVVILPSGQIQASLHGMGTTQFCNINTNITLPGGTIATPQLCQAWLSMLMTARSTQQHVTLVWNMAPASTCATIPVFNYALANPFPDWIELSN